MLKTRGKGRMIIDYTVMLSFPLPPLPASLPLYRGLVPLHNACSYGHYEVTELLLKVILYM